MTKEESYLSTAQQLLELVGGKENVVSAAHCATRLRLVLKDESKANVEEILKLDLVKGQFASGGQFQVIIGSGTVDEVYKRFIQEAQLSEASKSEVKKDADQKMNPVQRLIKALSDVFVPLIPALVASGLLMTHGDEVDAGGGEQVQQVHVSGTEDTADVFDAFFHQDFGHRLTGSHLRHN